jgi:hypothetical protein
MLVAIAHACSGGGSTASVDSTRAQWLAGMWDVHFHLDAGYDLRRGGAPRDVRGRVALVPNHSLDESYPDIGRPTNYGTYDVDFTPLGIEPRSRDQTPTVVAGWRSRDSVQIVLTTGSPSLSVALSGRAVGDSVVGTWRYTLSRAAGGEGTFILRRSRVTP